jgi:hypothetical protein
VTRLRQHPAFCGLEVIRMTSARALDPGAIGLLEPLLDVLHLLREIGREGAWMLGFRFRALGRVHVWVHRN